MLLFTFFRENVSLSKKKLRSNVDKSLLETSFTALSASFSGEGRDKSSVCKVHSISLTLTVGKTLKMLI